MIITGASYYYYYYYDYDYDCYVETNLRFVCAFQHWQSNLQDAVCFYFGTRCLTLYSQFCITRSVPSRTQPSESLTAIPIKKGRSGHPTLGTKYRAVNSCDPNREYAGRGPSPVEQRRRGPCRSL